MRNIFFFLFIFFLPRVSTAPAIHAQSGPIGRLKGFIKSPFLNEQILNITFSPEVRIQINAPSESSFDASKPAALVFYALPNGNTIDETIGKKLSSGDDWHYDIQHIGAQTRFLRRNVKDYNLIIIYLQTEEKSWPLWRKRHQDNPLLVHQIVDSVKNIFRDFNPFVVLTGHSGGGGFTFSFMNAFDSIPDCVKRISFLDSDYNYDDTYGEKLARWLKSSESHFLSVIAYNDSIALYNGKPFVSPTGGTWYRTKMMQKYLSQFFKFTVQTDTSLIKYTALNGRIKIILKENPGRQILHTVQVEKNGFIQGMASGTPYEEKEYSYFGPRAYTEFIQTEVFTPAVLPLPQRPANSLTGSAFMQKVQYMTFEQREAEIYNEISRGNLPDFLRNMVTVKTTLNDAMGKSHIVSYSVTPDYLAVGSNEDFCRIPMGPLTAQRIADLTGTSMPTSRLVDDVYKHAEVKLAPVTYYPVGNANELVSKFIVHNEAIDSEMAASGGSLGQLTGGTKKDVVISNKITDPSRPRHVVIYGWHRLDGAAIQPLTNIHIDTYVDYSHGIRLLDSDITIDGQSYSISKVLTDPALYSILSSEGAPMSQPGYIKAAGAPLGHTPGGFGLFQNYPNPFNPVTVIPYQIPEAGNVKIVIIDILGREVANILDREVPAGRHEIRFNAQDLPGGIYFCHLKSGSYSETRKLVLLK
ncbi:MAG TPA: T9SS type A sorting domain-containing protein [Ignavibacteriales bacterium]|nr:T9SS type A sorting domain-containing protein [Ignavibacteriales bacterium]